MILTDEQKKIIDLIQNNIQKLKINAFAGTGKTTTLLEITKANPNKKTLYLAFNKSIANEAKQKFSSNTDVYTTHALAYKYTVIPNNYTVGNIKAVELMDKYNIQYKEAVYILNILEFFCNSDYLSWDEIEADPYYTKYASDLFIEMIKNNMQITHSFYIKQFHLLLEKKLITVPSYDMILLDEAQDTNDVTLAIFNALPAKQKIIVGDKHQQIYSFRGSVNALEKFKGKEFYLTNSFRFNQGIAERANRTLFLFKNEKNRIKGLNTNKTIKTKAYISRTNSKLIEIIGLLIKEKKFFKTIRNPYEIFGLTLNLYNLEQNKPLDKQYEYLQYFKKKYSDSQNILTFIKDEATEADDIELISAINIITKYKGALFNFYKIAKEYFYSDKNVNIFLTTAHTSKGLEFDEVELCDDFPGVKPIAKWLKKNNYHKRQDKNYLQIFKKHYKNNNSIKNNIIDEINLYYVALTRAKINVIDKSIFNNLKTEFAINFEIDKILKK